MADIWYDTPPPRPKSLESPDIEYHSTEQDASLIVKYQPLNFLLQQIWYSAAFQLMFTLTSMKKTEAQHFKKEV